MGQEEESDYTLNQIHNFMSVQPYKDSTEKVIIESKVDDAKIEL